MKNVQNTSLQWSALDVEAYIDNLNEEWTPGEAPTEFFELDINSENCEELQQFFADEINTIIQKNEDNIIEYINNLILDHICENRAELVDEIKKIITPILEAKKTLQEHGK